MSRKPYKVFIHLGPNASTRKRPDITLTFETAAEMYDAEDKAVRTYPGDTIVRRNWYG
jgi:hypothetical protein